MQLKLNGTYQLLVHANYVNLLGDNIDTTKKNRIDGSKEIGDHSNSAVYHSCSNTGVVDSNPPLSMDFCVFLRCFVLCVESGLATGCSRSLDSLIKHYEVKTNGEWMYRSIILYICILSHNVITLSLSFSVFCAACQCLKHFTVFSTLVTF
jgi:hypothetical protein